jgi:SAM-dependent methyltransferase
MTIPDSCKTMLSLQRTGGADFYVDLDQLKPYLPKTGKANILDIGCGIGAIDVLIDEQYPVGLKPFFYLHDVDRVSHNIFYGHREVAAVYNSAAALFQMMAANGVQYYSFIDADKKSFVGDVKYDMVISLLSLGYHYPVGTYIYDVKQCLAPGAPFVLDCRDGQDGIEVLQKAFGNVKVIARQNKSTRVVCYGGV